MRRTLTLFPLTVLCLCVTVSTTWGSAKRPALGSRLTARPAASILFGTRAAQPRIARLPSGRALAFGMRTPATGRITLIKIYVESDDTANWLIAGIYANNAGRLGPRLSFGSLKHVRRGAWNAVRISNVAVSSGRTYWVAILGRHGSLFLRERVARSCTSYTSAGASLTSLPASWHKMSKGRVCEAAAQADGILASPSAVAGNDEPTTPSSAGSTSPPPFILPAGVTVEPVDGGSCTTSTGPCYDNYYCSHGLTNACNAGGAYPAKSWDDPTFFPIAQDYFGCTGSVTPWLNEGLNVISRLNNDCTPTNFPSIMRNNHLWLIAGSDNYTNEAAQSSGFGPETVGWHMDEPVTWNQSVGSDSAAMAQPNPSITAAVQAFSDFSSGGVTGRFLQPVFTANEFPSAPVSANKIATGANGIPSSCGSVANSVVAQQSVMSCTSGLSSGRHMDIATLDSYWFAGSDGASHYTMYCQYLYGVTCNNDQVGRASNYGDTIDVMRSWTPAPHVPSAAYIETGNGLVSGTSRDITPMEFNWADWDELIHGARMLLYFTWSADSSNAGFPTTSVGGTTMAAQGTATDDLVESLAPIINSPFALNYATNSAGGYAFPTEHLELDNGVDESVHYYTGNTFTNSAATFGPGFYIIVTPRGSESQTMPETVTFTLPSGDTTPAGGVQDVCACSPTQSTGNVSYNSSTHQFTETFNSIGDVHIIGPFQ